MAKKVVFISAYQLAVLLKSYPNDSYESLLETLIDEGDPLAQWIDKELDLSWWEDGEYYGFCLPRTKELASLLKKMAKSGKQFIPVDEDLLKYIPHPPKKWRWRQVDKYHSRYGFRKEVA